MRLCAVASHQRPAEGWLLSGRLRRGLAAPRWHQRLRAVQSGKPASPRSGGARQRAGAEASGIYLR
eukprot:6183763-Prymnesium_polylepis.3